MVLAVAQLRLGLVMRAIQTRGQAVQADGAVEEEPAERGASKAPALRTRQTELLVLAVQGLHKLPLEAEQEGRASLVYQTILLLQ